MNSNRMTILVMMDLRDKYNEIRPINSGAFGQIYEGIRQQDNLKVAIKVIDLKVRSIFERGYCREEIRLLKLNQNNPNIIKLYESFEINNKLYLILEYLECSLQDVIDFGNEAKFTERNILKFLKQITNGLFFLYQQNIIHRDLKPDNIMISLQDNQGESLKKQIYNIQNIFDRLTFKLIDLGVSKQLNEKNEVTETMAGSQSYMAPEIQERTKYGFAADIYSLGVITYELIYNEFPFSYNPFEDHSFNNQKQPKELKLDTTISSDMRTMLKQMLSYKPENRINIVDLQKSIDNSIIRLTEIRRNKIRLVNNRPSLLKQNENPSPGDQQTNNQIQLENIEQKENEKLSPNIQQIENKIQNQAEIEQQQNKNHSPKVQQIEIKIIEDEEQVGQEENKNSSPKEIQIKNQQDQEKVGEEENVQDQISKNQSIEDQFEETKQEEIKPDFTDQEKADLYNIQFLSLIMIIKQFDELLKSDQQHVEFDSLIPQINFLRRVSKYFFDKVLSVSSQLKDEFNDDQNQYLQYFNPLQSQSQKIENKNSDSSSLLGGILRIITRPLFPEAKQEIPLIQSDPYSDQIIDENKFQKCIQDCFGALKSKVEDLEDYQKEKEICQVYKTLVYLVRCYNIFTQNHYIQIFKNIQDNIEILKHDRFKLLEFLSEEQEKQNFILKETS